MNEDASKIWENYTLSKAALAQFDKIDDKHNITTIYQSKLVDSMKVDHVLNSTFYDDVDIQEVLKDLREIKRLKSPRFDKNEAFSRSNLFTFKPHKNEFKSFNEQSEKGMLKKVENRMKSSEKLMEKSLAIVKKPIKPILEKPIQTVVAEVTSEPNIPQQQQQNEEIKLSAEINLKDENQKLNGETAMASNCELITESKESIDIKNLPNSEKTPEVVEIASKITEVKINGYAQANELNIDDRESVASHDAKQPDANEIEKETKQLSPLNVNGNISIVAQSKLGPIEKLPTIVNGSGLEKQTTSAAVTNGFARKLTTFEPISSESDSAEISEQISIGQQRLIKSPEDFWI